MKMNKQISLHQSIDKFSGNQMYEKQLNRKQNTKERKTQYQLLTTILFVYKR